MNHVEPQQYIDLRSLIDQECIEMYRELKLDRSRGIDGKNASINRECIEDVSSR